ncbi:hypothetical protein CB0940_05936 [Cercospora beticola]|uniref:Uncharacterized protein n=1 Tax=Cercospora beticola TaxID=122368 RepID=A0A2G5HZB5_CERBT|nr:hypothetical protein CB0940_05936 [Cercospora beticola]PIA97887.1 hypothetical protein CB0940_05936 [Cercospora beticola]
MPSDFISKFNAQAFTGPYEYLCVDPPEWADEDDEDNEDEDSGIESDGSDSEEDFFKEPAADHPTHKWILMREGLDLLVQNCHEAMQRNPDNYGMHVFSDYWAYAIIDLIETLCKSADTALKARPAPGLGCCCCTWAFSQPQKPTAHVALRR